MGCVTAAGHTRKIAAHQQKQQHQPPVWHSIWRCMPADLSFARRVAGWGWPESTGHLHTHTNWIYTGAWTRALECLRAKGLHNINAIMCSADSAACCGVTGLESSALTTCYSQGIRVFVLVPICSGSTCGDVCHTRKQQGTQKHVQSMQSGLPFCITAKASKASPGPAGSLSAPAVDAECCTCSSVWDWLGL